MLKKLFAVLLCAALVFSTLPIISVSAVSYSGTCGENLTWSLDTETGVLEISGNGNMTDWSHSSSPWYSYRSYIKSAIISDGVTNIGNNAFYNCSSLTSVTIPDSVISIGNEAFYNTGYYNDLSNWENDVLYIGKHLIKASTSIYGEFIIKEGTLSVAAAAFQDCSSLTSITIPDSVTSVGYWAFQYCSSLTSITIPDSVTSIGDYAFSGCSSLTSVIIGNSVTSIGNYAFGFCRSLTSVIIGNSVTSIGNYAFSDCSIKETHIKNAENWCKTLIGGGNYSLVESVKYIYNNGEPVIDLVIPDGVTNIGDYRFNGCSSLTSVTIPDSVTSIGENAFNGCYMLEDVYIKDIAKWCEMSFGSPTANPICYANNLYLNGELVTNLSIPDGTKCIENYAFYYYRRLSSIEIPDSVESIGTDAFCACVNLKNIKVGSGVTSLTGNAFHGCSALENFEISENNSEYYTQNGCVIQRSSGTLVLGGKGCIIPSDGSVKKIGEYAFSGRSGLRLTVPESIKYINYTAFNKCNDLMLYVVNGTWAHAFAADGGIPYEIIDCAHSFSVIKTVEPTYTARGIKALMCDCGESYSENYGFATCDINRDGVVDNTDLEVYESGETPEDFDASVLDFDSDGEQSEFDTQIFARLASGCTMDTVADANGDGKTNLVDLLRLKRLIANTQNDDDADFDGSGSVDSLDLAFEKRFLLTVY